MRLRIVVARPNVEACPMHPAGEFHAAVEAVGGRAYCRACARSMRLHVTRWLKREEVARERDRVAQAAG